MKTFKRALTDVAAAGKFTAEEARFLSRYDWHAEIGELSGTAKTEAETLLFLMQGMLEEIREGYVEDKHDPEMLRRVVSLARQLVE